MPATSTASFAVPGLAHAAGSREAPSVVPAWTGIVICLLLTAAQIALGGYQLGVGNQAIQIAFLKHAAQPSLYANDPIITQTLPLYPTFFFRMLAPLLHIIRLENLYLVLQFVASFAILAVVYLLARSIFRSHASALAAVGLMVAAHLTALAGDTLYSPGFTHTYAALPIALATLTLAYHGRWTWACILAGMLFNFHALTAAYTILMLGAAMFADFGILGTAAWLSRTALCAGIVLVTASPTLALLAHNHPMGGGFTAQWINLTRIRSADHSFPSTWWAVGDTDIPRFVLFFALFALAWSFPPVRRERTVGGAAQARRITILMTGAVLALFLFGYIFTEIWPSPLMIRLQPFRASRLLLILMLVHIAHAAITAIRMGYTGTTSNGTRSVSEAERRSLSTSTPFAEAINNPSHEDQLPDPIQNQNPKIKNSHRFAELLTGILILATIAIPALLPLLPVTVTVALGTALFAGHLSWRQAIIVVAALLIAFLAVIQIQFPAPFYSPDLHFLPNTNVAPAVAGLRAAATLILILAATFTFLLTTLKSPRHRVVITAAILFTSGMFLGILFHRNHVPDPSSEYAALAEVSKWANTHTAPNTVFLAPTGLANFRIASERSLVTSWRDGTQLYFSADFGSTWLDRITKLEPGLAISADGSRLVSRGGDSLDRFDDATLLKLAQQYHANYILLPTPAKRIAAPPPNRNLVVAHADAHYTVYEPRVKAAVVRTTTRPTGRTVSGDAGILDPDAWAASERFMQTTVASNIERYRKADVTIQIVDANGRPLQNAAIKADQTKLAFTIAVSLGFFEPNDISPNDDQKPPPVRPIELEKAPEVFNGSMIPFSSKWQYLEPQKGQYRWSDLDQYVDYCAANKWTVEFHHLSGTLPTWVESMGGIGGQTGLSFSRPIPSLQTEFNRHCLDTVTRYADRVKYWQVVNEKYMMQYTPAVFKMLKEKFPNNQFGLSDCVRFWDGSSGPGAIARGNRLDQTQYKGADAVDWLLDQGIHPDFFSIHGHWPLGLWADPREIYNVIEYFAKRNIRVHISEELLQLNAPICGPLRYGTWTPELQGEYLVRLFTVAFSNPNVDMINYWGMAPSGWGHSNGGFIDASGHTRASFDIVKQLTQETWRSHANGTTSLEGAFVARVFHGTYQVTVTLPSGQTTTAVVVVPEKPTANIRLQLTPQGTLKTY